MTVVGGAGESQLEGPKAGPVLLRGEGLKRLGGRPKEKGLVDVARMRHQCAVGGDDGHRPIVNRLDQTRTCSGREQPSARWLCFALLAPVAGDDLVLEGVDHLMQLAPLCRELGLHFLHALDRLG